MMILCYRRDTLSCRTLAQQIVRASELGGRGEGGKRAKEAEACASCDSEGDIAKS